MLALRCLCGVLLTDPCALTVRLPQGYSFKVVTNLLESGSDNLQLGTHQEQLDLLAKVKASMAQDLGVEKDADTDAIAAAKPGYRRKVTRPHARMLALCMRPPRSQRSVASDCVHSGQCSGGRDAARCRAARIMGAICSHIRDSLYAISIGEPALFVFCRSCCIGRVLLVRRRGTSVHTQAQMPAIRSITRETSQALRTQGP